MFLITRSETIYRMTIHRGILLTMVHGTMGAPYNIDDTIRLGAPYDSGDIVSTDYFFSTKNLKSMK